MSPKDKAEELVSKFLPSSDKTSYYGSIECALIAVDEIISATGDHTTGWWEQVKEEIEKL